MSGFPSIINIELTNICNKDCFMCGRRKKERENQMYDMYSKAIDFELLKKIATELSDRDVLIQFHWDGEPTLYPRLGDALKLFNGNIRCFDTNGKMLVEKSVEIIGNVETITLSTFEDDPDRDKQWMVFNEFLAIKGDKKPNVIIRRLGNIPSEWMTRYDGTGLLTADRILHSPDGSFGYSKKTVVPEHGICLEALIHPAINVDGNMSQCVRYDPDGINILGNIYDNTIEEVWNGDKRKEWLQWHINGKRSNHPMCSKCEFWGIPRG